MDSREKTIQEQAHEIKALRARLEEAEKAAEESDELRARMTEAEEALAAIRNGEVEALVIATPEGDRVFTLEGADTAYRVLVENMQEGAVTLLADGTILYANQRFAEMAGQPLEKITGTGFGRFVHPDDQDIYQALRQECHKNHSAGEIRLQSSRGHHLAVYLSLSILHLQGVQSTCVVLTDLSAQKRNEQIAADERLARAILEQAGECIVVCDEGGVIIRANEEARRVCGRNPLRQAFADVFPLKWADEPAAPDGAPVFSLDALLNQPPLRDREVCYRQSDGQLAHFLLNAGVLHTPEGARLGSVISLTNITERKQAEEDIRQNREWLRVTLTSIGDAVIACDTLGRISFCNPVAAELTGWQADHTLGQPVTNVFKIINEQSRQPADDIVARVLRERRVIELSNHTALVTGDGREIPVEDSASPILDGAGGVTGVVLVFHDVTEKRRAQEALRESERRYRDMLSNVELISLMLDREGRITFCNDYLLRLTGWQREEVLGSNWFELFIPPGSDEVKRAYSALLENLPSAWHHENEILTRSGEQRFIRWNNSVLRSASGDVIGTASIGEDITERKRAEDVLREANERLAEADRRKDEFLAMLAHELRNPLAPIRYAAQVLHMKELAPDQIKKQHAVIDRQVSHMGRLLDDLLDVSRITRGKIQLKRRIVDLRSIAAQVLDSLRPMIEGRGQHLYHENPSSPLPVNGDPTRLEQIICNLLHNAHKYTEAGGCIKLSLALDPDHEQEWRAVVRVIDSGIGIPPETLPLVFEVFVQAEQGLARTQGGLGIGLAMVKNLVQMHGGQVEAHSAGPGQGSEFVVRLPLATEASDGFTETSAPAEPSEAARPKPRRVLVVDDNVDAAVSLGELLGLWGHEVQTVQDGRQALATARQWQPEIVLLDIGLPGMDGYEVARRLREDPATANVFLVALTGYGQEEDRRHALDSGFDRHLTKPVELGRLQDLIHNIELLIS